MNFEEALKLLREGKKVRRPEWEKDKYIYMSCIGFLINEKDEITAISYVDVDWEEYVGKSLLTQQERDILKKQFAVFKDFEVEVKVDSICKYEVDNTNNMETAQIRYRQGDEEWSMYLPLFKKDTMFKELKLGKYYSLEELGLD